MARQKKHKTLAKNKRLAAEKGNDSDRVEKILETTERFLKWWDGKDAIDRAVQDKKAERAQDNQTNA